MWMLMMSVNTTIVKIASSKIGSIMSVSDVKKDIY